MKDVKLFRGHAESIRVAAVRSFAEVSSSSN